MAGPTLPTTISTIMTATIRGAIGTCTTHAFATLLLLVSALTLRSIHAFTSEDLENACEYKFDLQNHTMRIICPGAPSVLQLFSDTTRLETGVVRYSKHRSEDGSSRGGGEGSYYSYSGRGRKHYYDYDDDDDDDDEDDDVDYNGNDPYAQYVWTAQKRLDVARRDLTVYTEAVKNHSLQFSEGDLNLRSDLDSLMRSSSSIKNLKEDIRTVIQNQFNFIRTMVVSRNHELEKLVNYLEMLVGMMSESMSEATKTHRITQDKVEDVSRTLNSVRSMLTSELRKRGKRHRRNKKGRKASIKGEGRSKKASRSKNP